MLDMEDKLYLSTINYENNKLHNTITNLLQLKNDVTSNLNNLFKYEKNSDTLTLFSDMYSRILKNLEKNIYSPYFAKIKYTDNNENKEETLYIGKVGFSSLDGENEYIIDWRAPISQLYYNSKIGKCSYTSLDNTFYGVLSLKRQFDLKDGNISAFYDHDDLISNDEFLKPYLTTSADNRLKSIVSTIQSEQDCIIRQPLYKNIIVQGVAGSGKTTVALHRLSYLVYTYEKKIKTNQYLIIAPSKIFLNYISSILPDLDVGDAQENTIEELAISLAKLEKYDFLNKHSIYNYLQTTNQDTTFLSFKSSLKFKKCIDAFLQHYTEKKILKDVVIKNVVLMDKSEVKQVFYSINENNDLSSRLDILSKIISTKLRSQTYINKINEACYGKKTITLSEKNLILTKIESGFEKELSKIFSTKQFNIINIYKIFIENINDYCDNDYASDIKKITLENLKNKKLGFEDLGPILYLSYKIFKFDKLNIQHILIDEAQDLGEFVYYSLRKIFNNSYFSIFGDLTQGIYDFQGTNNWQTIVSECFENNAEIIEMKKSYRTTVEIMTEANKISNLLGYSSAENVLRHGASVIHKKIQNRQQDLLDAIKYLNTKSCNTIAIICKNNKELSDCCLLLKDFDIYTYDENDNEFQTGSCIITVQTSKGLEFDGVIIYDKNSYNLSNSLDLKCLYVAETRALHNLIILN